MMCASCVFCSALAQPCPAANPLMQLSWHQLLVWQKICRRCVFSPSIFPSFSFFCLLTGTLLAVIGVGDGRNRKRERERKKHQSAQCPVTERAPNTCVSLADFSSDGASRCNTQYQNRSRVGQVRRGGRQSIGNCKKRRRRRRMAR